MIHFFTHCHAPSLPHVKCLLASLRRHEPKALITVILDDAIKIEDSADVWEHFAAKPVAMMTVEKECRKMGLDFTVTKSRHTPRNYAWTMQACLPYWMLQRDSAQNYVYVDSDVYFFQPITPIIEEIPDDKVCGICPHRFPPGKENESAGIYNNGVMWWLNCWESVAIAQKWGRDTIDLWRPGAIGEIPHEQKLLNEFWDVWPGLIHIMPSEVDVGPWQRREFSKHPADGIPMIHVSGDADTMEGALYHALQSYHFHEFRRGNGLNPINIKDEYWNRTNYPLDASAIELVYRPYESEIRGYV